MCDNCVTIGETFQHNADCEPGALTIAYTRSVLAFSCPVCGRGLQRPTYDTLDATPDKMRFTCDTCESAGTRKQIENSAFYSTHIAPRTCPLCGDKIKPAADKMTGDWWMTPSHTQIWRCEGDGCGFVGTFSQFCDKSDRRAIQQTIKDFSMDEVSEIPY